MRSLIRAIALTAALATAACSPVDHDFRPVDPSAFSAVGEVRAHASGAWLIQAPASEVYDPTNLPSAYQQDGLRVYFTAVPVPGPMNRSDIGLVVELRHIELR